MMSQTEVSEELARRVEATTGESDLERGIYQLLYQGRGRFVPGEGTDSTGAHASD